MVNSLPNGIDTQLGVWFNNGVQLSGGQWQKIALSRAFLRDADCYILDEITQSLQISLWITEQKSNVGYFKLK